MYESGGFDVEYIRTVNVKKKNILHPLRIFIIRLLAGSINNRMDIIFAMGIKNGIVRDRYPTTCHFINNFCKYVMMCKYETQKIINFTSKLFN